MKSSFTIDDLFLFAINETLETEDHMKCDELEASELKHEFREILGSENFDSNGRVSPEKRLINNIMSYSRALNVVRTKQAGTLNLLMN